MQQATLCFLMRTMAGENEILLAMKKRGFGVGKWNGVGGKPQDGESIEKATIREMQEEISVEADIGQLEKKGSIRFYFPHKPDWDQEVHIYTLRDWRGEPMESEEMKPQWYKYSEVPYNQMWCDDKCWLPIVLRGNKIEGEFYLTPDGEDYESYSIRII